MREPHPPTSPVDQARIEEWLESFAGYRTAINQGRIQAWLKQFAASDRDIAARVLDTVEFFSVDRIAQAYRQCLMALPGWDAAPANRTGRWRFSAMSGSAGESGDSMTHQFRVANGMAGKPYKDMFISPASLVQEQLGPDDTVVLLDDFIGTGQQVITAWKDAFSELVAGAGKVYLLVVAARMRGRERVEEETALVVQAAYELNDSDNFFGEECHYFNPAEKNAFRRYCKRANRKEPAGFGDCGLVVVFSHRCPNNSVAALHAKNSKWRGLFPRN